MFQAPNWKRIEIVPIRCLKIGSQFLIEIKIASKLFPLQQKTIKNKYEFSKDETIRQNSVRFWYFVNFHQFALLIWFPEINKSGTNSNLSISFNLSQTFVTKLCCHAALLHASSVFEFTTIIRNIQSPYPLRRSKRSLAFYFAQQRFNGSVSELHSNSFLAIPMKSFQFYSITFLYI